jgi:porphobilinogen synthase
MKLQVMKRFRRTRNSAIERNLVAQTRVSKDMFVFPLFIVNGSNVKNEIEAMPGIFQFSIDTLLLEVEELLQLGLNKVLLFGAQNPKNEEGSTASFSNALVPLAIKELRKKYGNSIYIITDVCLCAYTTHGHCGVLHHNEILNDASLEQLSAMALSHVQAGANMVAPSDMMDGRVAHIRSTLDKSGFVQIPIMSYSTKFASAYYGPFREAADSSPQFGDRKTYQMDYRNGKEAINESLTDEDEGADILMVKPALAYLDIINEISKKSMLPVACYNVSGEYSMVKNAAKANLIDEQKIVIENMYAFARAGASIIITYHAKDIVKNNWM